MVYVGVDLHGKVSQIAALDPSGKVVFNRRVPSDRRELPRVFGELEPGPIEVAFEATYGWG